MGEKPLQGNSNQVTKISSVITWHRRAVAMMVVSAILNSTGGLLVRSIEAATDWQLIFWRGLALGGAITCIVFFQNGRETVLVFRQVGVLGIVAGMFYAGTVIFYILSITHTTVANTVFILSAIPFFTAIIAWVILGEQLSMATMATIAFALCGIAIMVNDGIAAGSIFGNLTAIIASICFACFVVALRKKRSINMLPATAIGSLIAMVVAAFMVSGELQISLHDLMICFAWGAIISSAGHFLVVSASRHLGGAELTLLLLIEFVLGPIWVWLLINEIPSEMTLVGGSIVLLAVAGHAMFAKRHFQK